MLIDDVKIKVRAGSGGDGAAAFNKTKMTRGPVGANGGNGGNVYLEGVSDLGALNQFRYKKELKAEKGENAHGHDNGAKGKDLTLRIPVGTVVHNLKTLQYFEITGVGQRVFLAKGGIGGRGNYFFRSSTNVTPKEFEEGAPGEEYNLRLELKLIADVGFVGLPNVGKSSLLNEVTRAKAKVANYKFTTLEPNLGVYYGLILADIPGLIEGASKGRGLGVKFLRHIERTKVIFHFIAADSQDPVLDYKTVRGELEKYSRQLLEKPEYLFVSRSDLVDSDRQKEIVGKLKEFNQDVLAISIFDPDSLERVKKTFDGLIRAREQKKVVVGGTFDLLHAGHKALLKKAFELGQVSIGLVSDEMAQKSRQRKVEKFEIRQKELANFIKNEIGFFAKIFEINDKFGPTLKEEFDFIVTSPETYETALEINKERKKMNIKPIEVVRIEYVLAEDKKPISSTRIYNGEIDSEGKLLNK
jgi:GTP-binding protein